MSKKIPTNIEDSITHLLSVAKKEIENLKAQKKEKEAEDLSISCHLISTYVEHYQILDNPEAYLQQKINENSKIIIV